LRPWPGLLGSPIPGDSLVVSRGIRCPWLAICEVAPFADVPLHVARATHATASPTPRTTWFQSPSSTAQQAALDTLATLGASTDLDASFAAITTLIELANVTLHPREKIPVLRALARCADRPFAVPVLLAHLEHPDDGVVEAALDAVGHGGTPFGGSWVLRWLRGDRRAPLAEPVLAAALLALGRTGHPETAVEVQRCWEQGLVDARAGHLALAEAVSPALWEQAEVHLGDPLAAPAAAMHLAATRHPRLMALLEPLLSSMDGELAVLAHSLLAGLEVRLPDHILTATAEPHPVRRRRLARGLRAWAEDEVLTAWREALRLDDDTVLLSVALDAGIPALQDAALERAQAESPEMLRHALRRVHSLTPLVKERLPLWMRHEHPSVAADAMRVHLNLLGQEALRDLAWARGSGREVHRLEWVRAWQNGWRALRDRGGRAPLDHAQRRELVKDLRGLVRDDPAPKVRRLALYAVGNLGLTELGDDLERTLRGSEDPEERLAAATSLAAIPSASRLTGLVEDLRSADDSSLRYRLVRAALACVECDHQPHPELARVVIERLASADLETVPPVLALLGRCGCEHALPPLLEATRSDVHRQVCVALTALGRLGSERALGTLLEASLHPDPERRLRAVEALGRLPGAVAADRLATVLQDEAEELDIRASALAGLEPRLADLPQGALAPPSSSDPLAAPILVLLRDASAAGSGLAAEDLDRRLESEVPGLSARDLNRRCRDGLQALRTAEFLHSAVTLPPGLDAAPPVLSWVKGLEVWLNQVLRPQLSTMARPELRDALRELGHRWPGMKSRLAPSWRDDLLPGNQGDLWHALARDAAKSAPHGFSRAQLGVRPLATVLLACAAAPLDCGLARWQVGVPREEIVTLANGLVALANQRNPLTHRVAGQREVMAPVRTLALESAGVVARLAQPGAILG
jgi:HEAT repeat protein